VWVKNADFVPGTHLPAAPAKGPDRTPASVKFVKMDDLSRMLAMALDRFQHHMHRSPSDPVSEDVTITAIPMKLDIWEPTEIFEVKPTDGAARS
jgi:hypothetical protein